MPETQEELRKKLEKMSPEELKEFQKQNCIFCHIVKGKVQARKIHEDDKVLAILDINPANPGHVLLMPKEHYMIMPQIPEEDIAHIFIIAKKISNALLKALEVRGTNIVVANGTVAGQRAQHFIVHIIPRKEDDGVNFELPQREHSEQKLESTAKTIIEKIYRKDSSPAAGKPAIAEREKEEEDTEEKGQDKEQGKKEESVTDTRETEKKPSKEEPGQNVKTETKKSDDEDDSDIDLDDIARVLNG